MLPKRYLPAEWRGDDLPNVGGAILEIRRVVVHVMQGTLEGTDAWFHNKESRVSAHFGVGKLGQVYQWVELDREAWAEMAYNGNSWSIEHEGDTGELLTPIQFEKSLLLVRWLCGLIDAARELPKGRAATFTTNPSAIGVIGHGDLGMAGGNHPECPGAPILHQFEVTLNRPKPPAPAPKASDEIVEDHPQVREAHMDTPTAPAPVAAPESTTTPAPVAAPVPAPAKSEATITSSQLKSWAAELAAIAGWANTFANGGHLDVTLRSVEAIASSVILVISHIFNKSKAAKS